MEGDQSNDEAGSREPVIQLLAQVPNHQESLKLESNVSVQGCPDDESPSEPPAQDNLLLPNPQNGLKLKSDVSKQGLADDEAPSEPPAQEQLVSEYHEGLRLEFDVLNGRGRGDKSPSESPAQEHLVSKSQKSQDSSVIAAIQRVIDHDDQTAVSPSTTFRPVNMVLEERSCSPQPNGLAQESGEQRPTAGRSESQQPQLEILNRSSGYSWQANDVPQIWDAVAKDSPSGNDQRSAESEAKNPTNDLSVGQTVLNQGSQNNDLGNTLDTRSREGSVLSSMQMNQMRAKSELKYEKENSRASPAVLDEAPPDNTPGTTFDTQSRKRKACSPSQMTPPPSSEIPSSHWNKEKLPSIDSMSLPPNAAHVNPRVSRWDAQRKYPWVGYLPNVNESRRFESQAPKGRSRRLIQGPTQPLGPPLKPFDSLVYEVKAQERWGRDHE